MQYEAKNPEEYITQIPKERKLPFTKLRKTILENLPKGFKEEMIYGMIGYIVPHSEYPAGYHVNPEIPLPFINIASQKNFIAFYHMGIYANKELHEWFIEEYPKYNKTKLDMGKSCIRFKKINELPFELIAKLVSKMSMQEWIDYYEASYKRK